MSDEKEPTLQVSALAMEIMQHPITGKQWISCDSIYDMFAGLAHDRDSDVQQAFGKLADKFRALTTYAQLDGTAPPDDPEDAVDVTPVPCISCGEPIVTATLKHMDSADSVIVSVDADPDPDGTLIPTCSATDAHPQLEFMEKSLAMAAGYEPKIALRVHVCGQS